MTRLPTLALLLALSASACAGARARQARRVELQRQLDQRALPAPLEQAWPAALKLLAEAGYPLVGKDRETAGQKPQGSALDLLSRGFSTRLLEGDRRAAASGMASDRTRYQIDGTPVPGGSRVTFHKIWENPMEPSERRDERDLEMELALWRRVDARAAEALLAEGPPAPTATPAPAPAPAPTAAEGATVDHFTPLRSLLGQWEGEGQGRPGVSKVSWTFELALRGRYVQLRGTSVFDPQPANPAGERHEEVSFFSWDRRRSALVWRQFNVEGFVNQFVLEKEEGDELTFVTESIEGLPPGFRARQVLRRAGPGELHTRFSLAAPGKDFELYSENRLRRVR